MRTELPAEGFLRHRGLILVAVGGAAAEGGLLTLVAPAARSLAPQVTALPSIAAYHDLRWLFTDSQSWLWFAGLVAALLIVRSVLDAVLLRLAWPRGVPPPPFGRSLASCAALTALAWLLLTPAATLAFGVAVIPFSWPFLAAFPIMLGIAAALSHGGAFEAWWRRLPPVGSAGWLFGSFLALTAAGAVIAHLPTAWALAVMAAAGLVNARAWYGIAGLATRTHPRPHESVPARVLFGLPSAPLAALLVLALVVGVARLLFTGTIVLPVSNTTSSPPSAAAANVYRGLGDGGHVDEIGVALDELNSLVGSMSPYGPGGAADLLNSVSEFGAKYFADVASGAGLARGADGKRIRWLLVIPLADAVTLPVCSLPSGVLVVPALHGGLLGDPTVLPMVIQFLSGHQVTDAGDAQLRSDAELITSAETAWRMPVTTSACPG